ncbi:hypothetical protein CMV_026654 [Castanea mollissima]|uniref:Uncharacterized protein n=1 Tax=Castanea mollissima TaxID=60419 RepID=A0A8J4QJS3_9ROSI|nr:hypothetical protein CMV_026654 [Castanea mollissima]
MCTATTINSGLVELGLAVEFGISLHVPFWVSKFFTDDFGVPIPTRELFWSLILTLLIPLILGKCGVHLPELEELIVNSYIQI